jgi:uncharacterized protein YebE (UPF0316 family)
MFVFNVSTIIWSAIVLIAVMSQILISTTRTIMMIKGKKAYAMIVGFFEAAIGLTNSILIVANAVKSGINLFIILFYSVGFALGLFLGMIISQKISKDILSIQIITKHPDNTIEDLLRANGFGVTCYKGSGKDGNLKVLNVICQKTNLEPLKKLVYGIDRKAMLASHTIEGLSGGFLFDIKSRI